MKIDKQLLKTLILATVFVLCYESFRIFEKPLDQANIFSVDFNLLLLSISNPTLNFIFSISYYLFHPLLIFLAFVLLYMKKREFLWKTAKIFFLIGFVWLFFSLAYPIAPPRFNKDFPQIRLNIFQAGDSIIGLRYASFPSFHVFSTFLAAFLAFKFFPRYFKPFLVISIYYSFVVICLGEHYWFDVLGGFLLSISAFELITSEKLKFKSKQSKL